jgi:hypothetical protein
VRPDELAAIKARAEAARTVPSVLAQEAKRMDGIWQDVPVLVAEVERLTMPAPPNSPEATHEATHPGFAVVCHQCRSRSVYVENTLGYSDASGMWGNVTLICANCGHETDLVAVG